MRRSALRAEIRHIAGRPSQALLLTGEPGVGKSTLMRVAADDLAAAGLTVLRATPSSPEQDTPYSVLADLLSTVDVALLARDAGHDTLLEILAGQAPTSPVAPALAASIALEAALAELVRAAPVVVMVDDVQWADRESVSALERAFRRSHGLPVYLVAAGTSTRVSAETPMALTFGPQDSYVLDGLTVDELEQVVGAAWPSTLTRAQVVALHEHTGGNPMWALEVMALGAVDELGALAVGSVPAPLSLARGVTESLEALSADAREVVSVVALLGRPSPNTLRSVLDLAGIPVEAVDEAEQASLIRLTTTTAHLAHPLLSSAATARLTPARRRELHLLIAQRVHDAVGRAQHLQQSRPAGPDEQIATALDQAATVTHASGARLRSAHFSAQAVERSDPSGERYQDRLLDHAQHLFSAGDHTACLLALSRTSPDLLTHHQYDWYVALSVSATASTRGHDATAAFLETQVEQVGLDPGRLAIVTASSVGDDLMTVSLREQQATAALEVLGLADAPNAVHRAVRARIRAQVDAGGGLNHGMIAGSTERESVQIVVGLDDTGLAATGSLAHLVDDVATSRGALAQLVEWARAEGKEGVARDFTARSAQAELTGGQFVAARRLMTAVSRTGTSETLPPSVLPVVGSMLVADGRHEELQHLVSTWEGTDVGTGWNAHLAAPALLGFSSLARGQWLAAIEHLRLAADRADALELVEPGSRFRVDLPLVEALLMSGETDEARSRLAVVGDFLIGRERPVSRVAFHRLKSMELASDGHLQAALLESDTSIRLAVRLDRAADEALARLQRTRVLMRLRKVSLGRRELDAAHAAAVRSTNPVVADHAETARTRTWSPRPAGELTAAEQRVLTVLLRGMTTKEIAADLFLSTRTVESHVAAILRKTGSASRAKLRHDLAAPDRAPVPSGSGSR